MTVFETLREEISNIDLKLLQLVSQRIELAKQIGTHKMEHDIPIRNYQVENNVIKRYQNNAGSLSISKTIAEEIAKLMIKEAVYVQQILFDNQNDVVNETDKKCLIIGGGGKMGTWLVDYFLSYGHHVDIVDPNHSPSRQSFQTLPESLDNYDIIGVATPLDVIPEVLSEVFAKNPRSLIFEIGSLKSNSIATIELAIRKGIKMVSCHPMFGADTKTLNGKNLVICTTGLDAVEKEFTDLFVNTAVNIVQVDLRKHDAYMAYTLGLPHAINLMFGDVILKSGIEYNTIMNFGGTTFIKQLQTTQEVFDENPYLYYWIQNLNDNRTELYQLISDSVENLSHIAENNDPEAFVDYMNRINHYFHGNIGG